jgi:cold shock CspA family protein
MMPRRVGHVVSYGINSGFGFVVDDGSETTLFFNLSDVRDRWPPRIGTRVAFIPKPTAKGMRAIRIQVAAEQPWLDRLRARAVKVVGHL